MIRVMDQVLVTDEEWRVLQDYKKTAPYVLMKLKSEAIILLSKGIDARTVADVVERTPTSVRAWARAWNQTRLGSVHTGHAGNLNAWLLTAQQREEVLDVLSRPPSEAGLPASFWDVPGMSEWFWDRFEVVYESDSSYHFLLHMAGLSFHRPEGVDRRRPDPATVEARMGDIGRELDQDWSGPDVLVVAADEVRIEHETVMRRAWYTRGTKTRIRVDRERKAQNYIGFLHQDDGTVDLMGLDWQNSHTISNALIDLTLKHPDKDIVIVWDNAAWHKFKELKQELGATKNLERVHLINLPPYCPDLNPIEHVWKEAKDSISNHQRATFENTRTAFETFITSNKFPYRLTKNLVKRMVYGRHETRSFLVSRSGRCSKPWSSVRPAMCEADAPRVSSGVSRWMVAILFLAAFQTCSTGLWSGAYGGRWIGMMRSSS